MMLLLCKKSIAETYKDFVKKFIMAFKARFPTRILVVGGVLPQFVGSI